MDNQHKLIKGYRDLRQDEIDLINRIKAFGSEVGELVKQASTNANDDPEAARWASIAKTDLQKGFMALIRSVARPQGFA